MNRYEFWASVFFISATFYIHTEAGEMSTNEVGMEKESACGAKTEDLAKPIAAEQIPEKNGAQDCNLAIDKTQDDERGEIGAPKTYDPLAVSDQAKHDITDFTVIDRQRRREIPIRVFLPSDKSSASALLFSHGLGGSREMCGYLGAHWAARGYATIYLQHPGSDDAVWKDKPLTQRMQALRETANVLNFMLRVKDVAAVLDQLEQWNGNEEHALAGRLNLSRVGMSGHSFGALTTQAVGGQRTREGKALFTDPRIAAALIMSPSSPRNATPQEAFGKISIPWMLMTGTKDTAPIGGITLESRFAVFPALPAGEKYEVVFHGAEHSAFTDRALPGDREPRNPNHQRSILALSTAFWDAYLRNDKSAKDWLHAEGPKSILEDRDGWRWK